jgi:hypothetical protein
MENREEQKGADLTWNRNRRAASRGIPSIARHTRAHWIVIDNIANGERAAGARTGVLAPLIYASQITGAICVDDALRSTVGRAPNVIWQARACSMRPDDPALRVRAARRRNARIASILRRRWRCTQEIEKK